MGVSDKAPEFCLPDTYGEEIYLNDYEGKCVVLDFFPKHSTKGGTVWALGFTTCKEEFENMGAIIFDVSSHSPYSHVKLIEKNELGISILIDLEYVVLEKFVV